MKPAIIVTCLLIAFNSLGVKNAVACTPVEGTYKCVSGDFDRAIDTADYIIVTKLEKYLPNYKGEYRVIMSLRGDIPVGSMVIDEAEPVPEEYDSCSNGIPLGYVTVFMGKEYTKDKRYYNVQEFECSGKIFSDKEDLVDKRRKTLSGHLKVYRIVNRILGQ